VPSGIVPAGERANAPSWPATGGVRTGPFHSDGRFNGGVAAVTTILDLLN